MGYCGFAHVVWVFVGLSIPIPKTERHKLRAEVGLFQVRMIQAVQTVRRKSADPTPHQPPSPLWLTRFAAQPLPSRETARNLRDQVGAPLRYSARNRKRKTETMTSEPVDPELWLQAAHTANNGEAVSWFTNIHRTHKPTQEEHTSKRWCLENTTKRWGHYLSSSDELATQHAQRAREIYCIAHTTETALQHLRELHTVYTNTLTAKRNCHLLVTNLLKEHIEAQRLHNAYTTMCLERRRWYDQAKHDTMRQYADMKTSLLSNERFERLRTDTDVLLAHHTQQALYTWLQQESIIQLAHETATSY